MSSSFDSVEDKSINIEELALFPSQKCTNNQTLVVTEYAVFFFRTFKPRYFLSLCE